MRRQPAVTATNPRRSGWLLLGALVLVGTLPAVGRGQTPPTYQPAEMQADLLRFKRALDVWHPGVYAHQSAAEFDAFFARLLDLVRVPRSSVDFHLVVMRLTARLGDGHTRAFPTNATRRFLESRGILPFHVIVQDERIFIRRDLSAAAIPPGSEIVAIGGVGSNVILSRLEPFLGTDGGSASGRSYRLGGNADPFSRMFPLVFGLQPQYDVVVSDPLTRALREVRVPLVDGATFQRRERERYGDLLQVRSMEEEFAKPAVRLRVERASGYALLTIRRFVKDGFDEPADAFPALYRDAFRQIVLARVGTLIIDLRGNGGGIGANAAHLVRYLSDSVFVPTRSIVFRGNDAYYAALTGDSLRLDEYFGLRPAGHSYRVTASDRVGELGSFGPVSADRYRGKVLVLIDGGTVSAAGMAAGLLRQYTDATFIGQEAGGYAGMSNGFRQLAVQGLHTDSGIDFPLAHSEFSISQHRRTRGVVPDHTVTMSIDDLRDGHDAILRFALSLAR